MNMNGMGDFPLTREQMELGIIPIPNFEKKTDASEKVYVNKPKNDVPEFEEIPEEKPEVTYTVTESSNDDTLINDDIISKLKKCDIDGRDDIYYNPEEDKYYLMDLSTGEMLDNYDEYIRNFIIKEDKGENVMGNDAIVSNVDEFASDTMTKMVDAVEETMLQYANSAPKVDGDYVGIEIQEPNTGGVEMEKVQSPVEYHNDEVKLPVQVNTAENMNSDVQKIVVDKLVHDNDDEIRGELAEDIKQSDTVEEHPTLTDDVETTNSDEVIQPVVTTQEAEIVEDTTKSDIQKRISLIKKQADASSESIEKSLGITLKITEREKKQIELMLLKSEQSNMKKTVTDMEEFRDDAMSSVFGDNDELLDHLSRELRGKTEEDIKAMTEEEMDVLYTINGEVAKVSINRNEKTSSEFRRDFAIMVATTNSANLEYEVAVAELNKAMDDVTREVSDDDGEVIEEIKDIAEFYMTKIKERIDEIEDETEKAKYTLVLASFESAYNLEFLKKFIRNPRNKNIYSSFRVDKDAFKVYTRYKKNIETMKLSTDYTDIVNMEASVEGYEVPQNLMNIVMYSLVYYISKMNEYDIKNKLFNIIFAQIAINAKNLQTKNKEESPERYKQFENSVIEIVKYFQ